MTFLRNNWTYEQGSSPALFREGRGFRDGTAPSLTLRDSPSGLGLSRPFLKLRSTRSSCPQAWLLQSRCSSSSPLAAPAHEVLALIWGDTGLVERDRVFDSQFYHWWTMWPWVNPFPFLSLQFFICGMGKMVPTSWACELLRGITQ